MKKVLVAALSLLALGMSFTGCALNKSSTSSSTKVLTQEVKAQLEDAADTVFQTGIAPGMMALISVEGEKDFVIKRGVSNIQTEAPMDISSYYRIASVTKTFTATAVLMLVDQGKVALDEPINTYLPELGIPNGDKITVRMLGNMTSGLYSYSDDEAFWNLTTIDYLSTFTPKDLLDVDFSHPVNFAPGAKEEYCNTNYVILGQLLEKITGTPASEAINTMIIQPLGLTHTYWPEYVFIEAPYIHGYNSDDKALVDATNWSPSKGYAAGQLVSNFADMKIWAKALAEGQLLSQHMKTERFKWIDDHYGFGVMKAGDWVGHPGTISGYNSHVFYNTKKHMTLVILANTDTNLPVEYFSDAFRKILEQ